MKRENTRKDQFIRSFPDILSENKLSEFKNNLKFSLEYFDSSQEAGQDFRDWDLDSLTKLLDKLKHYCKHPKDYWKTQRVGGGGLKILEIYGNFPPSSDFIHPKHIPLDICWARFRLDAKVRLVGFFLTEAFTRDNQLHNCTFYVTFLDKDHRFYKIEEA